MLPDFLKPTAPVDLPSVPTGAQPPSPFCEWTTASRFFNNQWWAVLHTYPVMRPDILIRIRSEEECERLLDDLIAGRIPEDTQQVVEGYRAHMLVRPKPPVRINPN